MSHWQHPQSHHTAAHAVGCLLGLLAVAATRLLVPVAGDPAAAGLAATVYASAGLFVLPLLLRSRPIAAARWIAPAVLAAALLGLLLLADPLTRGLSGLLPALLLTMLLASASVVLVARVVPASLLCTLLITLTLAPVWAAPLVELAGNPTWMTRLVVSGSPLTAFAVPLELDYLRTSWFYAHSALGSMRYDYPDILAVWLGLSVLPAAFLVSRLIRMTTISPYSMARGAHP